MHGSRVIIRKLILKVKNTLFKPSTMSYQEPIGVRLLFIYSRFKGENFVIFLETKMRSHFQNKQHKLKNGTKERFY